MKMWCLKSKNELHNFRTEFDKISYVRSNKIGQNAEDKIFRPRVGSNHQPLG